MWTPIISEHKVQIDIYNKIDDIYDILVKRVNEIKEFDLYGGKSGTCLFMAYYQAINKTCKNNIEYIVESIINDANLYKITNYKHLTYYSEMAWILCHLYEKKLINIDLNDYFYDIDEYLYEGMTKLWNMNEHGCVNGAISLGMYFYYRYMLGTEQCRQYLEFFVDLLKETAIEKDNTMKWITTINYETNEQGYNLGIAHGIPGILLFLRKLLLANIKKDVISDILTKASNFLLQQKHSLETNKSFFNFCVCTETTELETSLAWCYGDISVGYSLYMISSLDNIRREDIKKNAIEILLDTTKRTYLSGIRVIDAGLCHGTSGIAHIYNRLYQQTNELEFREAARFWYKETIKMAKYDNKYAGYRLPYGSKNIENKQFELSNLSFLIGISGIGLSLLSAIYPADPSWDMCLLLS